MVVIDALTMALERLHGLVRGASFALKVHAVVDEDDDELAEEGPEEIAVYVVFGTLEQLRWVAEQFEVGQRFLGAVDEPVAGPAKLLGQRFTLH